MNDPVIDTWINRRFADASLLRRVAKLSSISPEDRERLERLAVKEETCQTCDETIPCASYKVFGFCQ